MRVILVHVVNNGTVELFSTEDETGGEIVQ